MAEIFAPDTHSAENTFYQPFTSVFVQTVPTYAKSLACLGNVVSSCRTDFGFNCSYHIFPGFDVSLFACLCWTCGTIDEYSLIPLKASDCVSTFFATKDCNADIISFLNSVIISDSIATKGAFISSIRLVSSLATISIANGSKSSAVIILSFDTSAFHKIFLCGMRKLWNITHLPLCGMLE